MATHPFQTRIGFTGDLDALCGTICKDHDVGMFVGADGISAGYEDFNVILSTSERKYFIKFFATFRSDEDCIRYLHIINTALSAGVHHPKLIIPDDNTVPTITLHGVSIRYCIMEFIDGKTFYELDKLPTPEELGFVMQQAAVINSLDLHPSVLYDSWACVNIIAEYEKNKALLNAEEVSLVEPIVSAFSTVEVDRLPHSFVHGDIIRTNVMRPTSGNPYILDFSVSNWYPRVQELAVLFCDLYFDEANPESFTPLYVHGLTAYQKHAPLTDTEIEALPAFIQAAHAMHVICTVHERDELGNETPENAMWHRLGIAGLNAMKDVQW